MGKLKVLPASVANMIAAGEVVQRPASVVKELVENAVDAGAGQVTVMVTDAGRTLIQVIDDGCGMSAADAVLCFERHATSKIADADDLNAILTYGFRGEALASIAAVSEVTLRTRRAQDETGIQVVVGDCGEVRSSGAATPVGSNFMVRNLFYNTPARRKFLKSDSVELRHIIDEFTRVAITRPEIGFSLVHNGRDIFRLKPAQSLKFRILDLIGGNVVGDVVDIRAETSIVNVSGFVGRPDSARKTPGNQFFFVNGRYFRSAYLHKAVVKAYEDFTADGMTPPYFIFLDIDPQAVDVNIHPTKTEVKFEDDSAVFQTLFASIRATLGRNSFGASIDFDVAGAPELPSLGRSYEQYRGAGDMPVAEPDPDYNPFSMFDKEEADAGMSPNYGFSSHVDRSENYGSLFEERVITGSKTMVLQGRYILSSTASGYMIVHVRRARERIFYDRYLKALSSGEHVSQKGLFPVTVQVGASGLTLFEENLATLRTLGFDMKPEGTDSIVVSGVPEGFSCEEGRIRDLTDDLMLILSDNVATLSEVLQQRMAEKFALLAVSHSETLDSPLEAQRIIDTLFASANPGYTPSGKPIVSTVDMDAIEKMF